MDLDLILKDIKDPYVRENFSRLEKYVQAQALLLANFTFFEIDVPSENTKFAIPHGLSFIPKDIIVLSKDGDQNAYFLYQEFDSTNIYVFSSGPVKIRFLAGQYSLPGYEKGAVEYPLVVEGNPVSLFSTKSFFTITTDNSTLSYAKAASDASYKYYNNMTWSMWVAAGPGPNQTIWGMFETGTANRSWLFSTQTDGTFRVIFSWDGTSFADYKTASPVLNYSWLHIVVTFSNGTANVYINNVLQSMTTLIAWGGGAAPLFAANVQHMIGSNPPSAPQIDNQIGGCFTNFSLWNKVLSATEITALYNGGVPGDLTKHSAYGNLTNWLRMDQTDTAPTLIDSKASAANMTITTSGGSPFFAQSLNVPT